jgi:signal transduction histidine kinase/CheY-like chemotaxis protein
MADSITHANQWPAGSGKMACHIREHNWTKTPLGPIEQWPQSLKTMVNVMLLSPSPTTIYWSAARIPLRNDACTPIAFDQGSIETRHSLDVCLDRVFAGEVVTFSRHAISCRSQGGDAQYRFFTGTCVPILGEAGDVGGALLSLVEVTDAVRIDDRQRRSDERHRLRIELGDALRRSDNPSDIMALVARQLGQYTGADRAGYYEVDDDHFVIVDEWRTPGSLDMTGRHPMAGFGEGTVGRLRSGEGLRLNDTQGMEDAEAYAAIGTIALLSVPIHHNGRWASGIHLHQAQPRVWTDGEEAFVREIGVQAWAAIERVRSEQELRQSEERYRTLFETIDEGFCVVEFIDGPDGPMSDYIHLEANPAYVANAGIVDIVGKRLRETLAEEADGWAEIFRNVLLTGEALRFERVLEATGRYLEVAAFRIEPATKRQVAIIFKDVTARRRAEADLRDLNDTLEQQITERTAERDRMWEISPDLMLVIDFDGIFRRVNPAWTAAPAGKMTYATGRDITDQKERQAELEAAQDQLRQAQKMEAMGQLTGGVAHDFNNLLSPIIGSLDMLIRKGVGNDRERRLIDGALESAERAKTLVQRLLAFARRQPLQPVSVDVTTLINGMAALLGSTLGPMINIRVEMATNLPPARADPNQLEMALLNLAVNARDAMPNGGDLTITATRESVRQPHPSGVKSGHYVRICVVDSGSGMDEVTLQRATEPFFSTKGVGQGTGLGLSMVHGLAAQLGGGLTIASTPGHGTAIGLWLPISPIDLVQGDEEGDPPPAAVKALGTALLVDDEKLVRMSTADMLDDLGYEVVEATSAEEALGLIRDGLIPDLLVTDHLMPGMTGAELARQLRVDRPGLPVLIVSGYADTEGMAPDVAWLTKPFRSRQLVASLSALVPAITA